MGGAGGGEPAKVGALVRVSFASKVGVLLDELPPETRDRVVTALLAEPLDAWKDRAIRQLRLVEQYANVVERFIYLPPEELWSITFDAAAPTREVVDGHDLVTIPYSFESVLLSDATSPGQAKQALSDVGGSTTRKLKLPIDPDLVRQRLYANCSINGYYLSYAACSEAVRDFIGRVDTTLAYERLPWDPALAEAVRVGEVTHPDGPDLAVRGEGLAERRLIYAYIPPDSCAIAEGCVGGAGYRRLLQFTATVHNVGGQPMHIGDVDQSALFQHNVFEYSPCHDHYHFTHYGDFTFGEDLGDKKAFCLISTGRYSNSETTPLVTPYEFCSHQGIASGWGDDYGIGLDCQWIDVTSVDTSQGPVTRPLRFASNPDHFLCEGRPILDSAGDPLYASTPFTTELGDPVDRPLCDFFPGHAKNNEASLDVTIPQEGSYINEPCALGELGPTRDCGFVEQDDTRVCVPGETVTLSCAAIDPLAPQVVRVCETSAVLGTGTACAYLRSLASGTAGASPATLTFTCPGAKDATEPGGGYSLYVAPAYGADPWQAVDCTP
jgi:hypothetical protein